MRTKVLALAALGTLGAALGALAQTNVYSLNAVGYINVTLPPGYSIIADQLWFDTSGSNTLGKVLPTPADSSMDNDQLYKFNGTGYATYNMDSLSTDGWDGSANATLNPGEGAFFHNIYSNAVTVTFVGTVPQGTNIVQLNGGYNLVSSPIPLSGGLTTVMGLPPNIAGGAHDNDNVITYNNTSGYSSYNVDSLAVGAGNPGYDQGSEPTVGVGQGFFYYVNNKQNPPNSPFAWTQVFSVNQ